jgi:hypothetical protein
VIALALAAALGALPPVPVRTAPVGDAALACFPVPAAGAAELRDRIDALLGILDRPVPAAAWQALPPGALPLLEATAADAGALPSRRARALDGAATLGADGTLHRALAADAAAPFAVRSAAVHGLGKLLSPAARSAALAPLAARDADPRIRAAAANVLQAGR